ncbi:hypothetical protein JMN32_02135 [Fulvivirga sp. 29W222]|uniref:Uncharacterized protein n=1 Tax=Fulvivirga marina TaxID=2494733 RepID=A0A937FV90_9BACT|nr:hypothetical protein [Fulvivirga marina]MBL6445088.1 hypothetical protein [Fulvivirga marina]
MENHFDLSDAEFTDQFASCKLDPGTFSHEAHLRLAWILIDRHGIEIAIEKIQKQLQNFVDHIGARDKYNKTLTVAATKAVYHFMLKSRSSKFKSFIEEFPQLKSNFRGLMEAHYAIDIYNIPEAKTQYLEPDLLPFD